MWASGQDGVVSCEWKLEAVWVTAECFINWFLPTIQPIRQSLSLFQYGLPLGDGSIFVGLSISEYKCCNWPLGLGGGVVWNRAWFLGQKSGARLELLDCKSDYSCKRCLGSGQWSLELTSYFLSRTHFSSFSYFLSTLA